MQPVSRLLGQLGIAQINYNACRSHDCKAKFRHLASIVTYHRPSCRAIKRQHLKPWQLISFRLKSIITATQPGTPADVWARGEAGPAHCTDNVIVLIAHCHVLWTRSMCYHRVIDVIKINHRVTRARLRPTDATTPVFPLAKGWSRHLRHLYSTAFVASGVMFERGQRRLGYRSWSVWHMS